jgi:hypothetical protein
VAQRVEAGRLYRRYYGVFAVGHSLLPESGLYLAAVLACGPEAVLSHRSAAAVWGIRSDSRNRIDVTAPGRRGRKPGGIGAHRDGSLRGQDRVVVDGIPCTSLARTLLDLAGVISLEELKYAIRRAEELEIFDLVAVEEAIARSKGRRGVARLKQAIAEFDERDGRTRLKLERLFLELCGRVDLPLPEVNAPLTPGGVPIEADFLWREARLVVETDGRATHGTRRAFEEDRRRDQRLTLAGFDVIRCTWSQVTEEPESLVHTIRTLLERGKSQAGATSSRSSPSAAAAGRCRR